MVPTSESNSGWSSCDLIELACGVLDRLLQIRIGLPEAVDEPRVLAVLLAGDTIGSVDETAIMPADEIGAGEGLAEKLFRPLDSLSEVVGDGAVGTRHGIGD